MIVNDKKASFALWQWQCDRTIEYYYDSLTPTKVTVYMGYITLVKVPLISIIFTVDAAINK